MVIQTWVFGRHFLENELSEPVTSRKATDSIYCQGKKFKVASKITILFLSAPISECNFFFLFVMKCAKFGRFV